MILNADVQYYTTKPAMLAKLQVSVPGYFVGVIKFRLSVLLQIGFAFEESTTTAENRVVSDMTQMVSQVIHTVQSAVTIPASKGRDHFAGEWMVKARNTWLIRIE